MARPDAAPDLRSGREPSRSEVRYATVVTGIGPLVTDFRAQNMLVFFGEGAPEELHEFVLLHRPSVVGGPPHPGDELELDGERFPITAVGHVVAENLSRLGHFALKANGATAPPLPGDVCVVERPLPELGVGSTMRILARPRPSAEHDQPPTEETR